MPTNTCETRPTAEQKLRTLLIIPAFNEAQNLPRLLDEIHDKCPHCDFVVINDGSTDNTSAVAHRLGATVLDLPINLGIGGAVQCGIRYAYQHGYDVCVQCDGDGQHDPGQIERLLRAIACDEADLVIGSRFLGTSGFRSTFMRRMGIALLSRWIRWFSGRTITDPTSGFRAMNRKVMSEFSRAYPQEYPEPESTYAALHRGYHVVERSVIMRGRDTGRSSIQKLDSVLYIIKVCLAIAIDSMRDSKQRKSEETPCASTAFAF